MDVSFIYNIVRQASVITHELSKHNIHHDIILKILFYHFEKCIESFEEMFKIIKESSKLIGDYKRKQ